MSTCFCDSKKSYTQCCEPFVTGKKSAPTPESLMRSRYTAYCQANMSYIQQTMRGKAAQHFNLAKAELSAKRLCWVSLQVVHAELVSPQKGFVTFIASYVDGEELKCIHENSEFAMENGLWYYIDGTHRVSLGEMDDNPPQLASKKIVKRNSFCPCGSLRKFKNCHGNTKNRFEL